MPRTPKRYWVPVNDRKTFLRLDDDEIEELLVSLNFTRRNDPDCDCHFSKTLEDKIEDALKQTKFRRMAKNNVKAAT